MQPTNGDEASTVQTRGADIVFACPQCSTSFVVDAAAAGVTLRCQTCDHPTTVPHAALEAAASSAIQISELQHQLKENASQRTEITGYINQLSIQLHRWQLRLKDLAERQARLRDELIAISGTRPE